jgi:hypothetical protein
MHKTRKRARSDKDEDNQSEHSPKAARADRLSDNSVVDLIVDPNAEETISQRRTYGASGTASEINIKQRHSVPVEVDAVDLLLSSTNKSLVHLRPALCALGIENAVSRDLIRVCDSDLDEPGATGGFGFCVRSGHGIS